MQGNYLRFGNLSTGVDHHTRIPTTELWAETVNKCTIEEMDWHF